MSTNEIASELQAQRAMGPQPSGSDALAGRTCAAARCNVPGSNRAATAGGMLDDGAGVHAGAISLVFAAGPISPMGDARGLQIAVQSAAGNGRSAVVLQAPQAAAPDWRTLELRGLRFRHPRAAAGGAPG